MSALLPQSFYARDALEVARAVIGAHIRHAGVVLRVTEAEAYRWPDDTANHCRAGKTQRNAPMWGPPGHAYVYLCYGIHNLLNLVTGPEGTGQAVLIRAAEPVEGLSTIQARRGGRSGPVLLTGPGKVGAALGLDRSFSHHPLFCPGGLELAQGSAPKALSSGPRVGIGFAAPNDLVAPWRIADADSRWVSVRKSLIREA
jgi:DNA-3-methyladenine glycosylase